MYGNNTKIELQKDLCELMELGMSFERKLFVWKYDLPDYLKLQPWSDELAGQTQQSGIDPISIKLSTVLQLRYLNVCILKDRPILTWMLKCIYGPMRDGFVPAAVNMHFMDTARTFLNRIEKSAREAIDMIWTMSSRLQTLGAWWFSNYYREFSAFRRSCCHN